MTALPAPSSDPAQLDARTEGVVAAIRRHASVVVALSGGVDSSVVAALARRALGRERVLAVTGVSPSLAAAELAEIRAFAAAQDLRHETTDTHELDVPGYVANSPDRCYFCKAELYGVLERIRAARGLAAILDGTCADDLVGHRPGLRAGREYDVHSPLVEAGAIKEDVRRIARTLGLRNADRPASPCLSSRIAYGLEVTPERLQRVAEAEAFLRTRGFARVRVRLHDTVARIEVPAEDLARVAQEGASIHAELRRLGFGYVTLDLLGLRSGSLLEVLATP